MSGGILRITLERHRQIEDEQFTAERDDAYTNHELANAACAYADPYWIVEWPASWESRPFKRRTVENRPATADEMSLDERIRDLTKAGALLAAEIDRLLRLKARAS